MMAIYLYHMSVSSYRLLEAVFVAVSSLEGGG
jgi:hypothetical protein